MDHTHRTRVNARARTNYEMKLSMVAPFIRVCGNISKLSMLLCFFALMHVLTHAHTHLYVQSNYYRRMHKNKNVFFGRYFKIEWQKTDGHHLFGAIFLGSQKYSHEKNGSKCHRLICYRVHSNQATDWFNYQICKGKKAPLLCKSMKNFIMRRKWPSTIIQIHSI